MKKIQLIILALSAILFASCEEDEPLRVYEDVNTTSTFRSGISSRAGDYDTDDPVDEDIPAPMTETYR